MEKIQNHDVLSCVENTFDILCSLETIIKVTQDICLDKEISAIYYNLSSKEQFILSEERNNYINMMNLALDKLTSLKEINLTIEKQLSQLK